MLKIFFKSYYGLAALVVAVRFASASSGISYTNVARNNIGLDFARTPCPEFEIVKAFQLDSLTTPLPFSELAAVPVMSSGYPGVAILDYDGDGDLDIYVSNGPGSPNSLFQNQLKETGSMTFVDMGAAAGVAATIQDSAGVCFGDMDNDGDHELVVLGRNDPNILFVNNGDGTFTEVVASGIDGGTRWSSSCSLGDVDGDGLLDLFVSNTMDATNASFVFDIPYALSEHNQLFRNNGDMSFTDISASSGVENTRGITEEGSPTITWGCAMVDVDLDGDIDIVHVDDQVAIPREIDGGADTGIIHVMLNDGNAQFEDHPVTLDVDKASPWMGVEFGDLNCDGKLDMFATNFGEFQTKVLVGPASPSRWFLGNGDGTFQDPKVGELITTPFGWGTAIFDYDNDGDLDIVFHGGLDATTLASADNPGVILSNDACTATFTADFDAIPEDPTCVDSEGQQLSGCTEHIRRNVRGVAVGDLNGDGFVDIVSAADVIFPETIPLIPALDQYGSPFDDSAFFLRPFTPGPEGLTWSGAENLPGDLAVEISSGNDNDSVTVIVKGSVGITDGARSNRDGVGAIITFAAAGDDGPTVMSAVTGGSSHLSQHALERSFGLGPRNGRRSLVAPKTEKVSNVEEVEAQSSSLAAGKVNRKFSKKETKEKDNLRGRRAVETKRSLAMKGKTGKKEKSSQSSALPKATGGKAEGSGKLASKKKTKNFVEILWPGGVRNRLYDVKKGRVVFPEIPCSFDGVFSTKKSFHRCVSVALRDLEKAGVVSRKEKGRFLKSMMKAREDARA